MPMLFAQDTSKSNELFGPQMGLTIQEAVPFLDRLAREPAFVARLLSLLERESEGWYVAHRRDAPDGSYSLQVFVWPPGSTAFPEKGEPRGWKPAGAGSGEPRHES
jgi:hypothetical protein